MSEPKTHFEARAIEAYSEPIPHVRLFIKDGVLHGYGDTDLHGEKIAGPTYTECLTAAVRAYGGHDLDEIRIARVTVEFITPTAAQIAEAVEDAGIEVSRG